MDDDIKQRAIEAGLSRLNKTLDRIKEEATSGYCPTLAEFADTIAAYEAALWSTDMDAAPRDGTQIDIVVRVGNKKIRLPDCWWAKSFGGMEDRNGWYMPRKGCWLEEYPGWEPIAWRYPPTLPEGEG